MIVIEPYDPSWPRTFADLGRELRAALGGVVLAIHHIGSTSVPGLAAKDVIDVQVTVRSLDLPFREPLEQLGYRYREDISMDHCPPGMVLPIEELEKRYFQKLERRVHLHLRAAGGFNQRYALLCRDYLRVTPEAVAAYAEIKRQLARYFPENSEAYYDVKDPVFDVLMAGARCWAAQVGWEEPPSDA